MAPTYRHLLPSRKVSMLEPTDVLTDEQVKKGLRRLIHHGVAIQTMATLTGEAFLVAFALKLGASNLQIGLLAAIGPLAQLLQLPATLLVERVRNRRLISVITISLIRLCWILIALSPLVFAKNAGLQVLFIGVLIASAAGAVANCSWNSWMRDLVPQDSMGSFFARRSQWAIGFSILASLAAGFYLDFWGKHFGSEGFTQYTILFLAGVSAGVLGLVSMARIPEQRMPRADGHTPMLGMLAKPFRDTNFRRLMWFLCSWSFALNLAGPFFMVYMLKRLGLSMSTIIGLTVLNQAMNFIFLRLWGRYTDRFSNKSVLLICGPILILTILAWTFTTMPDRHALTMPLLIVIHAFLGIASSGLSLATGNIGLKLAPAGESTIYLATNSLVSSAAAGVAPILGGQFADFFAGRELAWTLTYTAPTGTHTLPTLNLQQWDFFFFLAVLLGLFALTRLRKVKEVGEVDKGIVLHTLMTQVRVQVRTLSSFEGLRQMVSMPAGAWERLVGRRKGDDGND